MEYMKDLTIMQEKKEMVKYTLQQTLSSEEQLINIL